MGGPLTQLTLYESFEAERRANMTWTPPTPPSLDGINEIYLDCETNGLKWWEGDRPIGLAVGWVEGQQFKSKYLPFGHRGGGNLGEELVKRWATRELRGKRITNLNSKFDNHNMYEWGVDLESQGCVWSDVAHYAALLDDHRKRFSLERLSQDFLGEGKEEIDAPTRMAEYHAGEVASYACTDVRLVHKLKEVMWPKLTGEGLQRVRQLEDDIIYPVCEMERNGSPLNMELLTRWKTELESKFQAMLWTVFKDYGVRIDSFTAPTDLLKLFKKLRLPVSRTEKGQASFSGDVLKGIDHEVGDFLLRGQKLNNLLTKYIYPYLEVAGSTGILRYHLHQLRSDEGGTVSGRFSSTDKNIQQVLAVEKQQDNYGPGYIIRELFIPEEGKKWVSADADQIEYRLFAHYSRSKKILSRYDADPTVSFHRIVEEMIRPFKPDIAYKSVKNLNFAKIYGAGLKKIAEMLGLERSESDRFVRIYDREFPEAAALLQEAKNIATRRGYVKTILGRRCRFPKTIPLEDRRIHKALNGVIQGSAADEMKLKLIELHRERKNTGLKLRLTNHDEACGDGEDGTCEAVREVLNAQILDVRAPLLWSVDAGPHWAACDEKYNDIAA